MWCLLRFYIYRDYYEQKAGHRLELIHMPSNIEYYLYLFGVPLIVSLIISLISYYIFKKPVSVSVIDKMGV